ncbi:FG-GAP-like repeat-containing protein, partial [Lamprobacter sp.]|uniref:FG-GAP-like repeat-containing protein n=1 Tax=Lamprobacter sp. TaxID=3100796 RepID=UPI002B25AE6F
MADLDGDGDLDALVGDGDGALNYFENTGSASSAAFAAAVTNPFGLTKVGSQSAPTFADLDGDGDLDALVGEFDGILNYFENTGSASAAAFASAQNASTFGLTDVGIYANPTFADLDGDGDLDALVGAGDGIVNYFENTGSASSAAFASAQDASAFGLTNVGSNSAPTFADLDGDGDLDALVGEYYGNLLFFENQENTAPSFTGLDGTPTFTEGGSAAVLDANVQVSDAELDALNSGDGDYHGASLTIARNGGADASDDFDFSDDNGISLSSGNLVKNGQTIATFGVSTGTLTITFTHANGETPTSADVDTILQQISYSNGADDPPASVTLDWTFNDGTEDSSGSNQTTVTITPVNEAPTLSANGSDPTFTED